MRPLVFLLGAALAACGQAPERNAENGNLSANQVAPPADNVSSVDVAGRPAVAEDRRAAAHPCSLQDGKPVTALVMRAIGTEPFWNARTDGRCVTYLTPEDQAGTRVWTKVAFANGRTLWTGALNGKPFILAIRPADTCSDGMSDKVYAYEAQLTAGGEIRRGCAEKL